MPRGTGPLGQSSAMKAPPPLADRPFTPTMAKASGVSRQQLRCLVADGAVRRVLRGVYVAAHVRDTIELRSQAAALVVSPSSVLCDRTAAWLHGVDVLWHAEHDIVPP